MKYALSHPYKFRDWRQAYWVGMTQLLVVIAVEFVNLAVLTTNHTIMDIIMNFLALYTILMLVSFHSLPLIISLYLKLPKKGLNVFHYNC